MRPLERNLLRFSACATILFILVAIFMPVFGCGCSKMAGPRSACLSNLKQQALGLVMYANDSDGRFARRDFWMDDVLPNVKAESVFHDLDVPKGAYSYAFNAALSGAKTPPHPEAAPMVYESVNPIRNASDHFASLPAKGRHGGQNNVAYADGHAKRVSP